MLYTKYELARIIGARALQISMGAPFLIELNKEELERIKYNPIEIAKLEFEKGLIPITVKRPHPSEKKELRQKLKEKSKRALKVLEEKEEKTEEQV